MPLKCTLSKKPSSSKVAKKNRKKRGILVQDGDLSPPYPPSALMAPRVRLLKIEIEVIAHTWKLIRVRMGWGGAAADTAAGNMYPGLYLIFLIRFLLFF